MKKLNDAMAGKKLTLNVERLKELTEEQTRAVAGGAAGRCLVNSNKCPTTIDKVAH